MQEIQFLYSRREYWSSLSEVDVFTGIFDALHDLGGNLCCFDAMRQVS